MPNRAGTVRPMTEQITTDDQPSIDEFVEDSTAWLEANALPPESQEVPEADDLDVAVFHNLTADKELEVLEELRRWNQQRAERGFHAIDWPVEYGGLGLSRGHARAYGRVARRFDPPTSHELFGVTTKLIASTIRVCGTEEQKKEFIPGLLRTDFWACQLFSEPGAGSDLAALATRVVPDGDEWVANGQKVWSSGAHFSQWGLLIARSDPDAPKHKGMTAFMVPLDTPGVEVRPIKQMSGGSSFGEVFFTDARIPDARRIGEVGEGWKVALTTLGFERDHSSSGSATSASGGTWEQLRETAEAAGVTGDAVIRDELMKVYIHSRVTAYLNRRAADLARSGTPGPEGSLGKLAWTEGMRLMSDVVSRVLGVKLAADSGERATFVWGEHILGAPGYRIAGGSDEVQRNIIGERVLGLPAEPRVDKGLAWKDIPR